MINYCHPACNIPCSLDLGQWMLSWWWAHKSHPFPTQSTHESWNLNVHHFRLRSELLWPSVPLSLPSETPDEWQQEQLYYCSPPPSPKIAWEKADPHQTLPEMRQEEAPSIGRTPQKEAPKSALKSLWVWAPQARSARSSVFYDSSKSLEPTAPGSGWIHTTQSIGHASVHSKAALWPRFCVQACKIETAYPSPFSGPVTVS